MSNVLEPVRRRGSAAALSICLVAATAAAVGSTADTASAQQHLAVQRLEAHLHSSRDPNGSGDAVFRLNRAQGQVCARVTWERIGKPNAAHIHRRSDGMVVVDLTGSVTGGRHCVGNVAHRLIGRILAHPGLFYFNVHNAAHPAGAIQGALHR